MMTWPWPIAILPNDSPLQLFKRAVHCPSEDQCNRLPFCVLFVLLLSFVYLIVFFSLDVCCRCTVLFLYAYTCVSYGIILLLLIAFFLSHVISIIITIIDCLNSS